MYHMVTAFGNMPHRMLKVYRRFSKHCSWHLQIGFASVTYVVLAVGSEYETKSGADETQERGNHQ
jgi:hypothetical protein